jgi:pyruvate/2-oxoglutarate dehydrogenase complex dihydrolipoamide dehydrogenase (E3) component
MGKRVALVERKDLGGSCINFGCTPTKAAIASARVAHLTRRGAAFGLNIPTVDVDFFRVLQRARDISNEFRRGIDRRMDGIGNPRLFRSHARFERRGRDGFSVRLGAEVVIADEVVIDTGTRSLTCSNLELLSFRS